MQSKTHARRALADVVKISCEAGFGRFDPKTNALDDEIQTVADNLIDLLARCLPKKEVRTVIDAATKRGIYDDAIEGGLSRTEARSLAGHTQHPLDKALKKQHREMTRSLLPRKRK